ETYAELPPDRAKGVDLQDASARNKLFTAWAAERQKAAGIDGITVLVCKRPETLRVVTGPETAQKWFSASDRDKLAAILLAKLNAKEFDAGLEEGLSFIRQRLQSNVGKEGEPDLKTGATSVKGEPPAKGQTETKASKPGSSNPSTPPTKTDTGFDPMWIVWGLLGLLGLWIVIGLLRALF